MFTITTKRIIQYKDEIISLYKEGKSLKFLAKYFNDDKRNIRKLLEDNDIEVINPMPKPYKINEKYFDEINSPNKAYILGMLYADGCNITGNKIKLSLQDIDKEILEKIKKEIQTEKPLGFYDRHSKNPKHHDVYELVIYNKHMSECLMKLGCVPNKSLILQFPNCVPDELMSHFIRGYFDGDGSLSKGNKTVVNIVSSMDFCVQLKEYLLKLNIFSRIENVTSNIKTGRLVISQKQEALKFLEYIYKDAEIYMERKYQLYIDKISN